MSMTKRIIFGLKKNCRNVPNCYECDQAFTDFVLIEHQLPLHHVNKSGIVENSTLCQIKKPSAELIKDEGEYTCELIKCNEPQNGGCTDTTEEFGQVAIQKINVKVS